MSAELYDNGCGLIGETDKLITVLAERNSLGTRITYLESQCDYLAELLDSLITRLKQHAFDDCSSYDFVEELDIILDSLPNVKRWWATRQDVVKEVRLRQRVDALNKLTRPDAVALGVENQWDDLADQCHMEE